MYKSAPIYRGNEALAASLRSSDVAEPRCKKKEEIAKEAQEKLRYLSPRPEYRRIDGISWRQHLVTRVTIEDRKGKGI